jgi:flavin-dependent dehydrogenase
MSTMSSVPAVPLSDQAASCDVLIIGAGPAGSTMASLLARAGRKVVLVEKAVHPRFHVGESLLPANGPLFDDLGVREELDRMAMPKWGVEFVSPQHGRSSQVEFAEAWRKDLPGAWQVRRELFDDMLFRRALALGAHAEQGCQVQKVHFDEDGATVDAVADGRARQWRARYVVDASGRDTLLAQQLRAKQKNRKHGSAALFGHFRDARRLPGRAEGNISVFWFEHGWFWFIPLADGTTSVGAVCWPSYFRTRQQRSLQDFFLATIAACPRLSERLKDATLVDDAVHAAGNYSYQSTHAAGERYLLLGDAYAFVDPVFSSGVYLAMASAFKAVPVIDAALDEPRVLPARRRAFEAHMKHGPREFSWFIYRMTNPAMRHLFMHPRNVLRSKEAVMSVLAGDIFGHRPYRLSLWFFKAVYAVGSLASWRQTLHSWRLRRSQLQQAESPGQHDTLARAR